VSKDALHTLLILAGIAALGLLSASLLPSGRPVDYAGRGTTGQTDPRQPDR
jgi:hypothetical protein